MVKVRRFIRHPADIPLTYTVDREYQASALKDVSGGGLCFDSKGYLEPGSRITIEIPLTSPAFRAEGEVVWCHPEDDHYTVGLQFSDEQTRFCVRMVEQVCHIEHYREDVRQAEGRELTSEEAAQEWVQQFASEFP